jgi:hypothetical protein
MWTEVEKLFEVHQHTVAAAGAFGTVGAVIVSLLLAFLARRAHRTRIRVSLSISTIQHSSLKGKEKPRYLTVSIINLGSLPASIPFTYFRWKLPFARLDWFITPWDYTPHDTWVPQRKYPFDVAPRKSETFFVSDVDQMRRVLHGIAKDAWPRWRFRFLRARVLTDDGIFFRAKIDRSVRKELRAIYSKKSE